MAPKTKRAGGNTEFSGFRDEAFRFLKGLAKNNDRDWFLPRKTIFEQELQEPMKQVLLAVEAEMRKNKVPLLTKPKGILSRIYRDTRFSANKDPYHTFVSGTLHRNGEKTTPGALYVHVAPKEQFAAAGFWQPERPFLTSWRLKIQEEPKQFLNVVKQLAQKKLVLDESHKLQRMPRGFEAAEGSPVGEYLHFQSFILMRPFTKTETMSANLPELLTEFALAAKPLLEYGWSIPTSEPTAFFE